MALSNDQLTQEINTIKSELDMLQDTDMDLNIMASELEDNIYSIQQTLLAIQQRLSIIESKVN